LLLLLQEVRCQASFAAALQPAETQSSCNCCCCRCWRQPRCCCWRCCWHFEQCQHDPHRCCCCCCLLACGQGCVLLCSKAAAESMHVKHFATATCTFSTCRGCNSKHMFD
jgi:hypothetical protein